MLTLGADSPTVLVFLPGFLAPPEAYRDLLRPVAAAGVYCHVPQLYPRGITAALGRHSVQHEAEAAADLVRSLSAEGRSVWLAGHSRGGQAAWRAAALGADNPSGPAGLILVDPVDGAGPRSAPTTTARPPGFDLAPCVIGAGLGGRCAPEALNHAAFAAASPPGTVHVVVDACGHGDMLCGRWRRVARALCGGGPDPDVARSLVSALMIAWIIDQGEFLATLPDGVHIREP